MTSYEHIRAALMHEETEYVPAAPIFAGVTRHLVGADYPTWSTDAEVCAKAYLAAADTWKPDALVTLIDLSVECDAWGQEIVYPGNEAAHPNFDNLLIQDIEDYEKIQKVDFRNSKRMQMHLDVCKRLVAEKKGELPIIAFVFGPLGVLSMMRGQQDMFLDLYDDPDAVRSATMRVAETLKEYVIELCDMGVDAIMWDTLFASGSIMSKTMWKDMEADAMRMLSQTVRDHGCMNMIHNCGQNIYFDVQIEAMDPVAISFLYPPDDCKDFAECKEKYGDKITLIGCVPPTSVTVGSDEEWEACCREQIETMGSGGGYILATGCEYPANAPIERGLKMIEIARTQPVLKK